MSNISNHDIHNFRDYMNGACSFDVPSLDDIIDYIRRNLEPEQVYRQTALENWAINNGFVSEADAESEAGSIKERCGELEKQNSVMREALLRLEAKLGQLSEMVS